MAIKQLRREIDDFLYQDVDVVEGYSFNQIDTIKRIHLYMNDQFESGDAEDEDTRIFHNIVKYRREAIARFLDIDTKDIKLLPMNPTSYWATHFLESELKLWLKKNKFGTLLNDMATDLATYGSCVLRKTNDGADIVDLRRFFVDPAVKRIKDSRFATIKHYMTPSELKEKVKDGWDAEAIERIIDSVKEDMDNSERSYEDDGNNQGVSTTPLIEVYERFGELTEDDWEEIGKETDKEFLRTHVIIAEPSLTKSSTDARTGQEIQEDLSEILFAQEWQGDYPFMDAHYTKTPGRWLGVGVVEDLFHAQERINEIENQKRVSMELSALHIFQTQDESIVQNVLTDLQSGDVIMSKSGFTPLANEERNLQAFQNEYDTWGVLADRISFANDVVTGQAIPASTPATNAIIQNTNSVSVFLFKRQNFALFLQDFFNELVLPQAVRDLSPEHMLRYAGDPGTLAVIDKVFINEMIADEVLSKGRPLTIQEVQAAEFTAKEKLAQTGSQRFLKIKENLYKDLEFEFDINIANEQENVQVMTQNTFSLLQGLVQNPTLIDDPLFKTLFFDYAQKVGINPARLEAAAAQRTARPEGAGLAQPGQPPISEAINDLVGEANQRVNEPAS
jgi:hypothetical protein